MAEVSEQPLDQQLGRDLFYGPLGIDPPSSPKALDPQPALDTARYVGTYETISSTWEVTERDGVLQLGMTPRGDAASMSNPVPPMPLAACGEDVFALGPTAIVFLGDDGKGRATHLHAGRAAKRAPD